MVTLNKSPQRGLLFFVINIFMKEKYMFIRGKRVLDQMAALEIIAEQSTYNQLKTNVDNFVPQGSGRGDGTKRYKRQYATGEVNLKNVVWRAAYGVKALEVTANALGGEKPYQPKIIFNGVDFDDEDTEDNITVPAEAGDIHFQKINLSEKTMRVRCDCPDFYWRFASFNAKDKSLNGRAPKPYQSKTNRGPVNPQQVPGMCKHLLKIIEVLKQNGAVN